MTAPEIDSIEGIKIGGVLIHTGDVDGRDVSVDGAKLDGVESGATADQTGDEIKTLYKPVVNGSLCVTSVWVEYTDAGMYPSMGALPANHVVIDTKIHVTEAFNGSGANTIEIGASGDNDAYATATDVSTIGIKDPADGISMGYNSSATSSAVFGLYTDSNSDATAGKALVQLFYFISETQP